MLGDEPPQLGDPAPDDAADRSSPSSCCAWTPLLRTSSEPHCRHTLLVVTDLPPPDELHAASPLSYSSLLRTAPSLEGRTELRGVRGLIGIEFLL